MTKDDYNYKKILFTTQKIILNEGKILKNKKNY